LKIYLKVKKSGTVSVNWARPEADNAAPGWRKLKKKGRRRS
jgi:hypothetical protein